MRQIYPGLVKKTKTQRGNNVVNHLEVYQEKKIHSNDISNGKAMENCLLKTVLMLTVALLVPWTPGSSPSNL